MNFDIVHGLEITEPIFSIIILVAFAFLMQKQFETALSLIVVGSHTIQYTKISLVFWTGSLLVPTCVMISLGIAAKLNKIFRNLSKDEKFIFYVFSGYFIIVLIITFNAGDIYYSLMTALLLFARQAIPFFGIYAIANSDSSIVKHIKVNSIISILILFGFSISIMEEIALGASVDDLRFVKFWNMGWGAFSTIALWAIFYHLAYLITRSMGSLYSYAILIFSAIIIMLSQTRGLVLSVAAGLGAIITLAAKRRTKLIAGIAILIVAFLLINIFFILNIDEEHLSFLDIYRDRFQPISGRSIQEESRYLMWQEGIAVILKEKSDSTFSTVGMHNHYIATIMSFGIFGVLFLIIIFWYVVRSFRLLKNSHYSTNPGACLAIYTTVGMLAHALVGGMLGGVDIYLYWSFAMFTILTGGLNQGRLFSNHKII